MEKITTKDVLLSTKGKLAELKEKLNRLSELTCTEFDKNVESVRYVLQLTKYIDKPELDYVINYNKDRLKGKYRKILEKMNLYHGLNDSGRILWDNNGNSYINNDEYYAFVPTPIQGEFRAIACELFDDEFVNEFLKESRFYPKEMGVLRSVHLFPDLITIDGVIKNSPHDLFFDYKALEKEASVICHDKKTPITGDMIRRLLDEELNEEVITDYQKEVITTSPETNKQILVPRFQTDEHRVDFRVVEDEKCLRLVRK